jgi:hypothetical protein
VPTLHWQLRGKAHLTIGAIDAPVSRKAAAALCKVTLCHVECSLLRELNALQFGRDEHMNPLMSATEYGNLLANKFSWCGFPLRGTLPLPSK